MATLKEARAARTRFYDRARHQFGESVRGVYIPKVPEGLSPEGYDLIVGTFDSARGSDYRGEETVNSIYDLYEAAGATYEEPEDEEPVSDSSPSYDKDYDIPDEDTNRFDSYNRFEEEEEEDIPTIDNYDMAYSRIHDVDSAVADNFARYVDMIESMSSLKRDDLDYTGIVSEIEENAALYKETDSSTGMEHYTQRFYAASNAAIVAWAQSYVSSIKPRQSHRRKTK